MWDALTKSSGINEKPGSNGKMGSWGLGKNASFAASRFRTALYATAVRKQAGSAGPSRRLFQGKAILASHRREDSLYNPHGYFGGTNYGPLQDDEIPKMFRLDETGTAIWIPGYAFGTTWEVEGRIAAIRSFFHAIQRDKLRLKFGSSTLNCENIRKFSHQDSKASRMLIAVSGKAQAEKHFDRLGHCMVYVAKDVDGTTDVARKHLAGLVRDAGMLLTHTRSRMGQIGVKLRIPRDWAPFAAVIHCDSQGRGSFLRDCENPSHDEIKHDYISDVDDKRSAVQRFGELGSWARAVIETVAAPDPSANQKNVTELSDVLPGTEPEGRDVVAETPPGELPQPREHQSVPKARRQSASGPPKPIPPIPPAPPPPPNPPNPPAPPRPPRPPAPPQKYVREIFRQVRFQRTPTDTHRVTVSFTADGSPYDAIELVAVGEDNREDVLPISHAKWNEEDMTTSDGVIDQLPRTPDVGERVRVLLRTREPIDDKCLALSYRRKKGGNNEVQSEP